MSKETAAFKAIDSCALCEPEDWRDPLYSNQLKFLYASSSEPIVGLPYCFFVKEGQGYYGLTDGQGLTGRVFTDNIEELTVYVGKKAYHYYKTYQKQENNIKEP